jgi:dipeptidyl aminopeptidase/acylaminoacyl peptidase
MNAQRIFLSRFLLLVLLVPLAPCLTGSIPVEEFFRESAATDFTLSPDGTYFALIGRDPKGKNTLYARSLENGDTKAWTLEGGGNSVESYAWTSDEMLVYRVTRYDYFFRGLYSVERDKDTINQLDFQAVNQLVDPLVNRESLLVLRWTGDGEIKPLRSELVEIHPKTGLPLETIWTYDGQPLRVVTDLGGRVRLLQIYEKGEHRFLYRPQVSDSWSEVDILGFGPSGNAILLSDYFGRDRSALFRYDTARQELGDPIYEDPIYDLHHSAGMILDVNRKVPLGIRYQADHEKTIWFSPEMKQIQEICDHQNPDTINRVVSANLAVGRFLIQCYSDRQPSVYRLLDYGKRRITDLWPTRPQIDPKTMAPVRSFEFVSRDALSLHGYLTRPVTGKPPYPTVVLVHGGPWARDTWGFDPEVQFLANRGYAVLQVNYRGSTGFGRHISETPKGDLKGMNDDIEDAVRWAIAEGHTNPDRVGIMGGSFGGYAALYGVTFKPELYKCAIGNAGVYDWPMLIDEKKGDFSNYMYDYLRGLWGEDYRDTLKALSPYYHVDQIEAPVFVAYGREDRTVKPVQSKRMIAAMKKHGVNHEVFSKSWEGHGFFDDDIQFDYYRRVEAFLKENL